VGAVSLIEMKPRKNREEEVLRNFRLNYLNAEERE
jgi:hypothetical protein